MPNHCRNTLVMAREMLPVIIRHYIGKDEKGQKIFDFERIEPIGDVPDWYEQRLVKWGTKWAGYDLSIGESTIDFFTAWTPPTPIIRKLAELYKDFVFRLEYDEAGMAFRGIYTAKWKDGGVLVEDLCWNTAKQGFVDSGSLNPEKIE